MKKISAPLAITIIIVLTIFVGGLSYCWKTIRQEEPAPWPAVRKKIETSNEFLEIVSPLPNQKIKSPIQVSGKSNFFEANTRIRIKDNNGKILADTFTVAEGWMDKLYPFSKNISYEKPSSKKGVVEVFEESAKDGSEINKITIPVIFENYIDETEGGYNCDELREQINELIEQANYCNVDSNCIVSTEFSCFHCYNLFNKDANLTAIREKARNFQYPVSGQQVECMCPSAVVDCAPAPTQEEIECSNNKCIKSSLTDNCTGPWEYRCHDGDVYEYSCGGMVKIKDCDYGCRDGACIESQTTCAPNKTYGCQPVTQGGYTDEPAPTVCGCMPIQCQEGEHLIASMAQGTWPDGSLKGVFNCTEDFPP